MAIRIGLFGDFNPQVKAHVAIPMALELAASDLAHEIKIEWLATPVLEQDSEQKLAEFHALWAVPGTPYTSMEGALNGIRFAREHQIPFLGTCGGFQHMLIEYARNVLGITEADHAESNPAASVPLVAPLACSVNELTSTFTLTPGSRIAMIYGKNEITEQYGICNYGLNADFQPLFEQGHMRVTGVDSNGDARIIELEQHPFFIGTLFQPERSAFKRIVHPLVRAFLQAARTA
ncbi:MAG TPA: hypothetical protein VFB60_11255 [Ktedonobacteraceae bacterium]|nr:hypothetical protein [Ktedonobacteraceae bacterium]